MRPFEAKRLQFSRLNAILDTARELGQRHLDGDSSEQAQAAFNAYCKAGTARRRILCSLHEAAHAAILERHGFRVLSVTIEARKRREQGGASVLLGGGVRAEYTPGRDRQWLVSIAAGPAIDEMLGTRSDDCFDGSDLRRLSIETRGDAKMLTSILEEAREEVINNASCIENISDALLASQTLSGDELRAIILSKIMSAKSDQREAAHF